MNQVNQVSPVTPRLDMDRILDDRRARIIVCCGSGGVGKTTAAAAIGLRAAERGRQVCVLTVDPARRLAQSMGLTSLDNTPRLVPVPGGADGDGTLHAMMLDMKRTFDEIVSAHSTPDRAEQIFENPFYQSLSSSFAGTQEYIAMEKLGQLRAVDARLLGVVANRPPAKATGDERARVPHHLIDIADPDEDYDAERFTTDADVAIAGIHARGRIPLVTGGTGLYLRALIEGLFAGGEQYPRIRADLKLRLDREGNSKLHDELTLHDRISAERIHANDTHRLLRALEILYGSGVPWSEQIRRHAGRKEPRRYANLLLIGLTCPRELLYRQIDSRTGAMLRSGLEAEVRDLAQPARELQRVQRVLVQVVARVDDDALLTGGGGHELSVGAPGSSGKAGDEHVVP